MENRSSQNNSNFLKLFNKKNLLVLFVLVLTGIFLKHSFRDIEFSKVLATFKDTNVLFIILWLIVFILSSFLRTYRWKFMFNKQNINFFDLFHALNIGNFASMILPFRAGEFVRPFYLNEWTRIGFAKAMTSVVIERVFDVLGMFTIYYLFVNEIENLPEFMVMSSKGLGFIALILSGGVLTARFAPIFLKSIVTYLSNFLPQNFSSKLLVLFDEVVEGLGAIKTLGQLAIIVSLTLLLWSSYAFSFALLLPALDQDLNIAVGAVTCVFVGLAIAAPNAPGFFLTFELGCTLALAVFAYSKEFSLAFALIAHALGFFSAIFIGIFSLLKKGLSLTSLKTSS